jgi:hypothetical protein
MAHDITKPNDREQSSAGVHAGILVLATLLGGRLAQALGHGRIIAWLPEGESNACEGRPGEARFYRYSDGGGIHLCLFLGMGIAVFCGLYPIYGLGADPLGILGYWFATVPILLGAFVIGYLVRFRLDQYANGTVALLILALILGIGYLLGPEFTPCSL